MIFNFSEEKSSPVHFKNDSSTSIVENSDNPKFAMTKACLLGSYMRYTLTGFHPFVGITLNQLELEQ